jgi:hypothetical protein
LCVFVDTDSGSGAESPTGSVIVEERGGDADTDDILVEPGQETIPRVILSLGQDNAITGIVNYPVYGRADVELSIDDIPDEYSQIIDRVRILPSHFFFYTTLTLIDKYLVQF